MSRPPRPTNALSSLHWDRSFSLTDKVQYVLAWHLYRPEDGSVPKKYHYQDGSAEMRLIDEVMAALVDRELKTNDDLRNKINQITTHHSKFTDPVLAANKRRIIEDLSRVLETITDAQAERFPVSNTKRIATKDRDDYIKIANKLEQGAIAGTAGSFPGYFAIKRIKKPTSNQQSPRKKYLQPWLIKTFSQFEQVGEDYASRVAEYILGKQNFYKVRKTSFVDDGDVNKRKRYLAIKLDLASDSFTSPNIKDPINLVESLTVALLLGHNEVKPEHVLFQEVAGKNYFKIIDWDIANDSNTTQVQTLAQQLTQAVRARNFDEMKEILSFQRLVGTTLPIGTILEADGKTYSQTLRQALDKMDNEQILTAIKKVADVDISGISQITQQFIGLDEKSLGQRKDDHGRLLPGYVSEDSPELMQKFTQYSRTVTTALTNLKSACDAIIQTPTTFFGRSDSGSDHVTAIREGTKTRPIDPRDLIKYCTGQLDYVSSVIEDGGIRHETKALVPFLTHKEPYHQLNYTEAIKQITPPINQGLIDILFPNSFARSTENNSSYPVIQNLSSFREIFKQETGLQKQVYDNLTSATCQVIDALRISTPNQEDHRIISQIVNTLSTFEHPNTSLLSAILYNTRPQYFKKPQETTPERPKPSPKLYSQEQAARKLQTEKDLEKDNETKQFITSYLAEENPYPTTKESAVIHEIEQVITEQKSAIIPEKPYRGIGAVFNLRDDGDLVILKIAKEPLGRFSIDGEAIDNTNKLIGKLVTRVKINQDGEEHDIKNMRPVEIARLFHQDAGNNVIFTITDETGSNPQEISCAITKQSIFCAKTGNEDVTVKKYDPREQGVEFLGSKRSQAARRR